MLELRFFVDGEEKSLPLGDTEIRFGRSGENEVVLPDYSVSRRHASITRQGSAHVISDLQSTNGVLINGQAVPRAQLNAGDVLKVGVFEIRVVTASAVGHFAAPGPPLPPLPGGPSAGSAPPPGAYVPPAAVWAEGGASASSPEAPGPVPFGAPSAGMVGGMAGPVASVHSIMPPSPTESVMTDSAISNATIVRSLKDLSTELALLEGQAGLTSDATAIRQSKRQALDEAHASRIFGFLSRLARMLITTESDDEILEHVMAIAFDVFPVDRGFILLRDDDSELVCELVRSNDRTEMRPQGEVPISKTMLEAVMRERVALLTYDALSDQRLAGTESVRIHQIRAAMCTPLWSGEKIIGVMQLDTPHHTGTFTEPDVDLLATLANYCAVAIERNRNARDAEYQREVRNRLQRYHSPSVIEEVMQEGTTPGDNERLKRAEVSVLFADIVGFTAYSELAAPEDVAELMERYFTYAVEAIFSQNGTLDKFIGDCVMAFFGAPFAQEDHAFRAVTAATKVREDLIEWNAERASQGLSEVQVRIAINTGPVVVGDIGSNRRVDYTVLGNTVNVAARLEEKVATPGDIIIGEATQQAVRGRIATDAMGGFQLKGLSQKIEAYRVR